MSTPRLNRGMETLPKGFHVIDSFAPNAAEVALGKRLSQLVASTVGSYSSATVRPADLKAQLHKVAVQLYLAQGLDSPSESMDDPVMLLLEKAQSLTP
jgi:hypothetical protein